MAIHSIEYLNARKSLKPASGGKVYARTVNMVDERARWNSLDKLDQAHETIIAEFSEFRSWIRNLPTVESIMAGEQQEVF